MYKLISPLVGIAKQLEEVDDPAFSEKILGDGIAIYPLVGELRSPFDGEITMLFPTKHAIGLTTAEGMELLIHIGIDTVNLGGRYFKAFVSQGDQVKQGDKLLIFDIKGMENEGYDIDTMIIITNSDEFKISDANYTNVRYGDKLLDYYKE